MVQLMDKDGMAVVWNDARFHIVNIDTGAILASCHSLRRIRDLAVAGREVFILETGRTVIRIAPDKDYYHRWGSGGGQNS